ncbi:hypothetical protein HELRODRAFT_163051 [Helobdella robusta]|uniref:Metaxin n=1 Tax=Helobdella robusta TaxID=6412 RepID=T1ETL8_HELRO|nr:hypothetical protein HELRODRAFT_163051 [Helobdella robusta]ESN96025.1 hypothetical protein HELRODRAFT_163051 [Helobdella robusta]
MELSVWGKHWGLPSIDTDCLITLAYCQFSDIPSLTVHDISSKWTSSIHCFPVLTQKNTIVKGSDRIIEFLKDQKYDCDSHLKTTNQSDCLAYTSLINKKLMPAVEHLFWTHTQNYLDITRPSWGSKLPFPLSLILPISERNRIQHRHENDCSLKNLTEAARNLQIINNAKECLNILSSKLGDKSYIFGEKPSSLDALIFGLLAPMNFIGALPTNSLLVHLRCCTNLTRFCQRVIDNYFPESRDELMRIKNEESEKMKEKMKETIELGEFPHKRKQLLIASIVVIGSMLIYAIAMGIIHVEVVHDENRIPIEATD